MTRKLRLREQVSEVRTKFKMLSAVLNEKVLRCWAAAEAISLGHGGIPCVAKATGVSESTIEAGIRELRAPGQVLPEGRMRKLGGGRKRLTETDPSLQADLENLVEPSTRGDPESPLRWTSKSTANLASELQDLGHKVSPDTVGTMLQKMDYSLQALSKTREGAQHPDRDAQFRHEHHRRERHDREHIEIAKMVRHDDRIQWWPANRCRLHVERAQGRATGQTKPVRPRGTVDAMATIQHE